MAERKPSTQAEQLATIAERAGVSIHIVRRVLNGSTKATWPSKAAQAERIRTIAAELGFRANAAARATASGRFDTVAMLNHPRQGQSLVQHNFTLGLMRGLQEHGRRLLIGSLPEETDADRVPHLLRDHSADALIFNFSHDIDHAHLSAMAPDQPVIWVNADLPEASVRIDEVACARIATEHILELGYQRIAYVDLSANATDIDRKHISHRERLETHIACMHEAGRQPRVLLRPDDDPSPDAGARALRAMLASESPPDALIGYFPYHLGPALRWCYENAIRVGRDLGLASFSSQRERLADQTLSCVAVPFERLGRRIAAAACTAIDGTIPPTSFVEPRNWYQGDGSLTPQG